ncbi:hypothetical protein CTI12_AA614550 [Artemisia annua]|uniref:BHLH domain-containing protein n=1 Tax=Artemisia annua TaxID=35608 RepID=A0A2U1KDR1_ARTAN|nr:hypothetical protein CTI12_AA614550 [Artemisia annua]
MIMFHQLPDLTSFENLNYPPSLPTFLSQPRKIPTSSAREKQQQKRGTLSEKTRALQKILPWDKKMDMGTLLEETYKYIKFLQAQVKVLELMPVDSSTTGSNFGSNEDDNVGYAAYGYGTYGYGCYGNGYGNNVYGGLGRLNRQQLLEVIVNSPVAQANLCSRGCCVYSTEQLVMFKDLAEKNYASMYY